MGSPHFITRRGIRKRKLYFDEERIIYEFGKVTKIDAPLSEVTKFSLDKHMVDAPDVIVYIDQVTVHTAEKQIHMDFQYKKSDLLFETIQKNRKLYPHIEIADTTK